MSERAREFGLRLSFLVPLTPWPVLLWIQSLGKYKWTPRHSAEALHAVAGPALCLIALTSLAGAFLTLTYARQRRPIATTWWLFAILNALALLQYIKVEAVAYD